MLARVHIRRLTYIEAALPRDVRKVAPAEGEAGAKKRYRRSDIYHGTCTGMVCGIKVYQKTNERLLPGERAADII